MDKNAIQALFEKPFMELVYEAATVHRKHFDPSEIQVSTLLSIKTGACPEDCKYCSQSGHYQTGLKKEKLMPLDEVIEKAKEAKANGATRFCTGAAWRSIPKKNMAEIVDMIHAINDLGMESCMTLGMLSEEDAQTLADAGLKYYNHNIDTSRENYSNVITTRTFEDRIDTLNNVRSAGIKVCCGGILGLGETRADRISFLAELSEMKPAPESVPINKLIQMKGTPFENNNEIDDIEFVRTIAVARIAMPHSVIRLTAGRESMSETMQSLCFLAGANSIFKCEKYLTDMAPNKTRSEDESMFEKLNLRHMAAETESVEEACCS